MYGSNQDNSNCRFTQSLLSDYVDNALSARQMWDVEKHLSACRDCSTQAHQMQETVKLLRTAPLFDTSDDFMAKLHARLDTVNPEAIQKRSLLAATRDWLAGVQEALSGRRTTALSWGIALTACATLFFLPYSTPNNSHNGTDVTVHSAPQPVQQALEQHVMQTAIDPLGDAAAENLLAHGDGAGENTGAVSD